ncbi:hypothetical protein [Shimia abyssi]|uniref:Uncharacterized protein n=1 Tax=Shimia abyssi TaxID=1662395 RepID=A0A2P8FFL5_9RHOB|nr:hypothetical protein [Shimia abyssi]PSL20501.1 hypothetical protein CLV88_103147 [Shimia abyssi]
MRDGLDPKGLIRESFCIDGITDAECRSIFLDWALSLPDGTDQRAALAQLVERYESENKDHPMQVILRDGLVQMQAPRRRGGWRSRPRS